MWVGVHCVCVCMYVCVCVCVGRGDGCVCLCVYIGRERTNKAFTVKAEVLESLHALQARDQGGGSASPDLVTWITRFAQPQKGLRCQQQHNIIVW